MDILTHVPSALLGLLAGAITGGISGMGVGCVMVLSYHRRGPSDPGDAPVYVAMGLIMFGACLGAIAGFIIGLTRSVLSARKRKAARSVL
jgi:hypothetical protein